MSWASPAQWHLSRDDKWQGAACCFPAWLVLMSSTAAYLPFTFFYLLANISFAFVEYCRNGI